MAFWMMLLVSCKPSGEEPAELAADTSTPDDTDIVVIVETAETGDTGGTVLVGTPVSDSFTYEAPVVDVLFILDTSSSMISKTETLISGLNGLVQDFVELGFDYHIGVTNIDETNNHGHLEGFDGAKWSSPEHPTPVAQLVGLVESVTDPSVLESGRSAAYKALELTDGSEEPNFGFLRDGSQVAVIVHTDETDQSGNNPINEADFITYMVELRDPGDSAFHSIAGTADYLALTNGVGGIGWSVDNTPYGPALQAIVDHFNKTQLTLSMPAVAGSFEIRVIEPDSTERLLLSTDFVHDSVEGTLELVSNVPQDGATVEVDYLTP